MPGFTPGPNTCQHCGATKYLSVWKRMTLSQTGSARCRVCGFKVGPDIGRALIALTPGGLFLLAPALAQFLNPVLVMISFVLMVVLSAVFYWFCVTLCMTEITTPSMVATGRAEIAERGLQRRRGSSSR